MFLERKYVPKYEDLVKEREKNKSPVRIDEIAKKYKMNVTDVKIIQEWKEKYEKEHKLRQEAETETILVKGIGMNSPEMKAAKEEINDLKNKIANLDDALRSKDYWREPYYKFLIEENAELQKRIIDLEQEILEVKVDNKKLAQQVSTMLERMRDADF